MTNRPSVSIIIRARNEAALIGKCLDGIAQQDYTGPVEVLVIDSGSTDGTVRIAKGHAGVKVIEIPPSEFNYGVTLNRGVSETRGEFIVALSAHCVPLHRGWLSSLVAPVAAEPNAAGSFGRQIPWPECEPLEATWLAKTFSTTDRVYADVGKDKSPLAVLYSNANSCFRRSVAELHPFPALAWAEDRVWAHRVLSHGFTIHYVADATVIHSHQRSVKGYFQTGRAEGRMFRQTKMPQIPLRSYDWFGAKPVYWQWLGWYRRLADRQRGRRALLATSVLARAVAYDLGHWAGERGW